MALSHIYCNKFSFETIDVMIVLLLPCYKSSSTVCVSITDPGMTLKHRYLAVWGRVAIVWWYRRSNLGQVTHRWQREQHMLLCSLTDKDLRRICGSQYENPCFAIGYWPEMCLDHVYIILEPVGSARLTFDDDLYYELCDLMTEVCSESRMRSQTWRGVSKWPRHKDW